MTSVQFSKILMLLLIILVNYLVDADLKTHRAWPFLDNSSVNNTSVTPVPHLHQRADRYEFVNCFMLFYIFQVYETKSQ